MENKPDLLKSLKANFNKLPISKQQAIKSWLTGAWVWAAVWALLPFVSLTAGAIVWVAWTIPQLRKTAKDFWNWIVKKK